MNHYGNIHICSCITGDKLCWTKENYALFADKNRVGMSTVI